MTGSHLPPIIVSWSTGKDSALALHSIKRQGYPIHSLVTVFRKEDDRVSVHGINRKLLRAQAESLGLPLLEIETSPQRKYEQAVTEGLQSFSKLGINQIAYGDLFLEDIKQWRDAFHQKFGYTCLYPLWRMPTQALAHKFIGSGFKAIVVCVDTKKLNQSFAGRPYDHDFLTDLPSDVDPCGENGEFHTFVYDGPDFSNAIPFKKSPPKIRDFEDGAHQFTFGFSDLQLA
ncbi:MAG: diphthine--ammonia ligase [Verrucomicrobiota bacterium]